jgi:hypothetical protein
VVFLTATRLGRGQAKDATPVGSLPANWRGQAKFSQRSQSFISIFLNLEYPLVIQKESFCVPA